MNKSNNPTKNDLSCQRITLEEYLRSVEDSSKLEINSYLYNRWLQNTGTLPYIFRSGKVQWKVLLGGVYISELKKLSRLRNNKEFVISGSQIDYSEKIEIKKELKIFFRFYSQSIKEWYPCDKKIKISTIRRFIRKAGVLPENVFDCIWISYSYSENEFAKKFAVKRKEAASILLASGYIKRYNNWVEEHERQCDIKRDFDEVENVIQKYRKISLKEKINRWIAQKAKDLSNRLSELYYRLSYSSNAHLVSYDDYVYKEINYSKKSIWIAIVGIIFTISFIILLYLINSSNYRLDTDDQKEISIASVLLTILSCVTSVATTIVLMRQNYKIDYHKERIEVLPVFSASVLPARRFFDNSDRNYISILKEKINENISVLSLLDGKDPNVVIRLKNEGKGSAYNICFDSNWTEYEEVQFQNCSVNQEKYIILNETQNCSFTCKYSDLYGNYYSQEFWVSYDTSTDDYYDLESEPPKLVFRTKRIRYVQ